MLVFIFRLISIKCSSALSMVTGRTIRTRSRTQLVHVSMRPEREKYECDRVQTH